MSAEQHLGRTGEGEAGGAEIARRLESSDNGHSGPGWLTGLLKCSALRKVSHFSMPQKFALL